MARASATAVWASLASLMVARFVAFSSWRSSVALVMALSSASMASARSSMSCASCCIEDSSPSISAWSVSTAEVFSSRVCLLVVSSVSHQPLCSASSFASSIRRTMRSLIIFFTFENGSSATRTASAESIRLLSCAERLRRNSATFSCTGLRPSDLRLTKALALFAPCWANDCALPSFCNFPSLSISIALDTASISSARNCWRDSKSADFWEQVDVSSVRYFWSSSRVVVVSVRSPSASALAWSFLDLKTDFSSRSEVPCLICASRS
mmetsp:Transcript_18324/g.48368  ORF Transcript_18324/g.48368 Transcript_18324/m.48368 type:complete len:267 (-) Transcript_18324:835-1635(-)